MTVYEGDLLGAGLHIGIVVSRFNELLSSRLLTGALDALKRHGVADADVDIAWVPGAFEIPLATKTLADTGRFDAVIALGAVIRGDTAHFDFVAGECARGIQDAQMQIGVPIIFGVLTTENLDQALQRSDLDGDNKGEEAARTALEMVDLLRRLPPRPADPGRATA